MPAAAWWAGAGVPTERAAIIQESCNPRDTGARRRRRRCR